MARYPPVKQFAAKLAKNDVNGVVHRRSVLILAVFANPFFSSRPILQGAHLAAPTRVVTQAAHQAIDQPFVFSPSSDWRSESILRDKPGSRPTDSLVVEARREIAEIVREVAHAVRSERTAKQFITFLADRVLRAMAAEGVIVWCREESLDSTRLSGGRESWSYH